MDLKAILENWVTLAAILGAQLVSYGGLKIQIKMLQEKMSRWDQLMEEGGLPMCRFHAQLFNQLDARLNKLETKIEDHRR